MKNAKQNLFHMGWLVLGILQMLASSGCGQNNASAESLLSSSSPTAQAAGRDLQMPVRVKHAFFESPLTGEISLQGTPVRSAVNWKEYAPTESAPAPSAATGTVLADFRDHQGCASFQDVNGVDVCFKIMGDVDSLGVNDREMQASGLSSFVEAQLGQPCPGTVWNVRFAGASRAGAGFKASFVAEPAQGCSHAPVSLTVSLSQS